MEAVSISKSLPDEKEIQIRYLNLLDIIKQILI